jgi:DegV family protein with EDD domain
MGTIGIVSDITAQFPKSIFPGKDLVHVITGKYQFNKQIFDLKDDDPLTPLPWQVGDNNYPKIIIPPVDQVADFFTNLLHKYGELVGIFSSSVLLDFFKTAKKIIPNSSLRNRIHLLDSTSIALGLGYMIHSAASISKNGGSVEDIEQMVRRLSNRIYTLFCFPSPSYLIYSGFLDKNQALVSEILGLSLIYSLEEGKLTPIQKEKNLRNVFNIFQEFLEEFDDLEFVAFSSGNNPILPEEKYFRQYCKAQFSKLIYNDYLLSPSMSLLFGPGSLSITIIESNK